MSKCTCFTKTMQPEFHKLSCPKRQEYEIARKVGCNGDNCRKGECNDPVHQHEAITVGPGSKWLPKPEPTPFTSHKDAFLGMCIHGIQGARFVDGRLVSYDCTSCFPTEEPV